MRKWKNTEDMTHDEWLLARKKGIGGSDAGAVCGMSKWKSRMDVYEDKTTDFPDDIDNFYMKVGRKLEQPVTELWEEETGKTAVKEPFILQHDEYDWMIANIDRWVDGENAGLEIKTGSSYVGKDWEDGKIPPNYELQCLHYMAVTGADKWYIACLIGNHELVQRVIDRDEEVINNLIEIEKDFWESNIVQKVLPPPDGSDASSSVIKTMYPESKPGMEVDLNDMTDQLDRYSEIEEMETSLKQEKEGIKQKIQLRMGEAEIANIGDRIVTWKERKGRSTIDTKKLKADHQDLYEKYMKQGNPYRVFLVK